MAMSCGMVKMLGCDQGTPRTGTGSKVARSLGPRHLHTNRNETWSKDRPKNFTEHSKSTKLKWMSPQLFAQIDLPPKQLCFFHSQPFNVDQNRATGVCNLAEECGQANANRGHHQAGHVRGSTCHFSSEVWSELVGDLMFGTPGNLFNGAKKYRTQLEIVAVWAVESRKAAVNNLSLAENDSL